MSASSNKLRFNLLFVVGILSVALFARPVTVSANYCPFCSAVALTFSEQLNSNDVVVVAKLLEVPPPSNDPDADFPKAKFEIVRVIKGEKFVGTEMKFLTQLVGNYPIGQKFLVMGVDPPRLAWSTPMKASDRVFQYLEDIQKLPEKGGQRLLFFQDYFEHEESMLAFDAYDEFARAPYAELIEMKDQMHRDKLLGWIQDPNTSVNRRRLYFTMLGVCGQTADLKIMEDLIKSDDRKKRAGLDALIASYLMLKGQDGVDLIEATFLNNPDADYVDILAAVSALRFHGTEVDVVSKERIVQAIRHLLDRPKMADMIIPDLARWGDWSVMERLVQMFKDADEETNWLRVPVITYLRACPKPEAKKYIEELAKIDPDAVRRADFFLGGFDDDVDVKKDSDQPAKQESKDGKKPGDGGGQDSGNVDSDEFPVAADVLLDLARNRNIAESEIESLLQAQTQPVSTDSTTDDFDRSHVALKVPVADQQKTETSLPLVNRPTSPVIAPNLGSSSFVSNSTTELMDTSVEQVAQAISESAPVASIPASPNLTWAIIFVPMGTSVVLFVLLWSVVNGWFERLIF